VWVLDFEVIKKKKDINNITTRKTEARVIYKTKRRKYFMFLAPTQLLTQGQWWSI